MELQYYLRQFGLDNLEQEYQIKTVRHREHPNLVCLNYSQRESPLSKKIVQQCRGIILDSSKDWQIISYPYDKFFNYGEGHAATINWSKAKVYEKLDGSLMVVYFYDGRWRVQSRRIPDASGIVNDVNFSFASLFWQVWAELKYTLPEETDQCFMFELLTPYNALIVRQESKRLILHGVRNKNTLEESEPAIWAKKYGWQAVKSYPLNNYQKILEASKQLNPMDCEGYIVCDSGFNRVKVKSPQYVALTHLKEGLSTQRILELVLANEGEEFLSYYPEWSDLYGKIRKRYENSLLEIDQAYRQFQHIKIQKEYALAIKHLPYYGVLFSLKAGKISSAKEAFLNPNISKMVELLKLDRL